MVRGSSLLTGLCKISPDLQTTTIQRGFPQISSHSIKYRPLMKCRKLHSMSSLSTVAQTMPEIQDMCPHITSHQELQKFSTQQPGKFWSTLARSRLTWSTDFHTDMDCDFKTGKFNWFQGGKLNVSVNCVDRWAAIDPERVALIWEKDEPGQEERITYSQLASIVGRMANCLKSAGVSRGDTVVLYMPMVPMAVAAMLATARLGAVHTIVFAGFSAESLGDRIRDSGAKVVITADGAVRGGKQVPLKTTVDVALESCPNVETVFVMERTGADVHMGPKDVKLEEAMSSASDICPPEIMDSEDPLFLLYTSGSTGKPKGISHSSAGYLLYAAVTQRHVFNYSPGDVFSCVADIGWITGHSYVVYGPLANGATTVLFESTPLYPDPGRYWEMVERLKVNQFYGSPTAIRLLLKYNDSFVTKYDRSSLKTLASVGEPLNKDAWLWFHDLVGDGRCDLVDTWWQTETGGIAISPRPSAVGSPLVPGKPQHPFLGMNPALIDEKGHELVGGDVTGALCMKTPWPGIARTIHGDHQRFVDTYFSMYPGYYFTGDGAHRCEKGDYQITGRMDDVINVTGHRLGTAEVECALTEHKGVAEAAVVGFSHDLKGEGVYAYISLKEESVGDQKNIEQELKKLVRSKIAAYAVPDFIQFTPGLPKTRSGKIMRRILRKVAANQTDDLGDISTLAEPHVVEIIVNNHKKLTRAAA